MLKTHSILRAVSLTLIYFISPAQSYFCPDPNEIATILPSQPKVNSVIRTQDGNQWTVTATPKYNPDPYKNKVQSVMRNFRESCDYEVTYTYAPDQEYMFIIHVIEMAKKRQTKKRLYK